MDDTPTAPPDEASLSKLRVLLCPTDQVREKVLMEELFEEYGYNVPIDQRVRDFLKQTQQEKGWEEALVAKWKPRLEAARYKKAAGPSGKRAEHRRPFYLSNIKSWAIIAEAMEQRVIPPAVRKFLSIVLTRQLLKKDEHGRYSTLSGTRPIGMMERLAADIFRTSASEAAHVVGSFLKRYGQYALGVKSGGEAVSTAAQLRISADRRTLAGIFDAQNAFCRADNELRWPA